MLSDEFYRPVRLITALICAFALTFSNIGFAFAVDQNIGSYSTLSANSNSNNFGVNVIDSETIDAKLGFANDFAVYADTFSRIADMEGNIACNRLIDKNFGDIGNSGNVLQSISSVEISIETDKPADFDVLKNGNKLETVHVENEANVEESGAFNTNDTYSVRPSDASAEYEMESCSFSSPNSIPAVNSASFIGAFDNAASDPGFQARSGSVVVTTDPAVSKTAARCANVESSVVSVSDFNQKLDGGIASNLSGSISDLSLTLAHAKTGSDVQVVYLNASAFESAQVNINIPYKGDITASDADTLVVNVLIPQNYDSFVPYGGCTPGGTFQIGDQQIRNNEGWGAWASHIIWNYVKVSENGTISLYDGWLNATPDLSRTAAWGPAGTHLAPCASVYYGYSTAGGVIARNVVQAHQEIHRVSYMRAYTAKHSVSFHLNGLNNEEQSEGSENGGDSEPGDNGEGDGSEGNLPTAGGSQPEQTPDPAPEPPADEATADPEPEVKPDPAPEQTPEATPDPDPATTPDNPSSETSDIEISVPVHLDRLEVKNSVTSPVVVAGDPYSLVPEDKHPVKTSIANDEETVVYENVTLKTNHQYAVVNEENPSNKVEFKLDEPSNFKQLVVSSDGELKFTTAEEASGNTSNKDQIEGTVAIDKENTNSTTGNNKQNSSSKDMLIIDLSEYFQMDPDESEEAQKELREVKVLTELPKKTHDVGSALAETGDPIPFIASVLSAGTFISILLIIASVRNMNCVSRKR